MASNSNIFWFWCENFFRNSIRLLSHYTSINVFYWTPFPFFSSYFFTYRLSFSVFWPVWALHSLESSVSYLPSCFCFFFFFCNIVLKLKTIHGRTHRKKWKSRVDDSFLFQSLYSRKVAETKCKYVVTALSFYILFPLKDLRYPW